MTHLGDRVTELVDGQLGPDATERAHAHLARCMPCREAVETERLMKTRLAALAGPAPSADLVGRLLTIGAPAADPLRPAGEQDGERPVRGVRPAPASAPDRPAGSRPGRTRPAGRSGNPQNGPRPFARRPRPTRPRRLAVAVFGALSVVGVGAAGLTFSTAPLSPGAAVPPFATFVVEHATTTRDLPFVDVPASWLSDKDDPDR